MSNDTSDPLSPAFVLPFNSAILGSEYQPLKPGMTAPFRSPCWVIIRDASLVVCEIDGELQLPEGEPPPWCPTSSDALCIGMWRDRPLLALSLANNVEIAAPYQTMPFNGPDATLDERLSTLAGIANQIIKWEQRSRYCGCCGAIMDRIPLTWGKCCPACRSEQFPHIHPCIIVLVKRGDEFLLVRNAQWPTGRFSLVAGFLDIGESLEECVKREVLEETGITVQNIRYVGSQSWPFPSQQMIGFIADHAAGEPQPDGVEVVEARWFTVDTMPHYPNNIRSIARWIMKNYCV
ncbi:MAG: NAD(+) diphosphatase [Deltaproteobacteria bacterium]|nr:NAD(+) diphosphatase [Deltaproteobacteria bacterium]